MLYAKENKQMQVRQLIDMIAHEKTQAVVAKIIATDKKAKKSLKIALVKIGERMQLLGALMTGASNGGQAPPTQQIKKLQRKVKFLQKKEGGKGGSKPAGGDETSDNFIPKAVLDAVQKLLRGSVRWVS
jgi:hypothetical protein